MHCSEQCWGGGGGGGGVHLSKDNKYDCIITFPSFWRNLISTNNYVWLIRDIGRLGLATTRPRYGINVFLQRESLNG